MRRNLFLAAAILALLVFIGYMTEAGPYQLFGREVSIWVVRVAWLLLAVANFMQYWRAREEG